MKYEFAFYEGFGIREIWSHTIKPLTISINAASVEKAVAKVEKKRWSFYRHNKAYGNDTFTIHHGDKTGIVFQQFKKIVWEGEKLYWGMVAWPFHTLQSFTLPAPKWAYRDNEWVKNYVLKTTFPTYGDAMTYTYKRMNYPGFGLSAEEQLEKYYYQQIDSLLNSDLLSREEKESIQVIEKVSPLVN